MELRRVVVTGLGAITPIGNNVGDFWNGLVNGVSGANIITHFDTEKYKTKFACEVKNFDPTQFFERKELKKLDPYARFAMVATDEAVKDSGFDLEKIDRDNVGVIWASGIGGIETFMQEMKNYMRGGEIPRFSPFFIPKMISDIAAGHISIKYQFRGPNFGTVSACASSANAIIDAFNLIRLGKANAFIAGGSEASINEAGIGGFNSLQAISTNNDNYQIASRPFDKDRDGFVMGEGGGALVLEDYDHAVKRGAKIYAEILGGGMSGDAFHLTATHPDGIGARLAMQRSLEDAHLGPTDVDYVNVHGTSTPVGDIPETFAIKQVFGEHAYNLNISSTKSMTGHLLGAAGSVESIAAILSIVNGIVPPTINLDNVDPGIDPKLNLTPKKAQKRTINAALSNTFGFGGHNTSIIFRKYTG